MKVFRLAREKYADSLSGIGAARRGARWNSPGIAILYCASSRALAMAEIVVHLTAATLPDDYIMITIEIPENTDIETTHLSDLPPDWNVFPFSTSTRTIGDSFVNQNKGLLLQVPSAVVEGDVNILINPAHSDFKKVKIADVRKFSFDNRLFH